MSIRKIDNPYSSSLITNIRDVNSEKNILKKCLFELGRVTSEFIVSDGLAPKDIITPMGSTYAGLYYPKTTTVIISTRDDYEYFAKGISSCFPNAYQGYMDFQGERGLNALKKRTRAVEYPVLKTYETVDSLVIAKSILATGCTAITLTKSAIAYYYPKKIIIAAVFYSERGIEELYSEIPNIDVIYIHGEPDSLSEAEMLIPGVGNLDDRLNAC